MNFYVKNKFGADIELETRYSPEYGIGVYRNTSTGEIYVIKLHDAEKLNTLEEFLAKAIKIA